MLRRLYSTRHRYECTCRGGGGGGRAGGRDGNGYPGRGPGGGCAAARFQVRGDACRPRKCGCRYTCRCRHKRRRHSAGAGATGAVQGGRKGELLIEREGVGQLDADIWIGIAIDGEAAANAAHLDRRRLGRPGHIGRPRLPGGGHTPRGIDHLPAGFALQRRSGAPHRTGQRHRAWRHLVPLR